MIGIMENLVKDATDWSRMAGSTEVVKRLNSYLTCRFISSKEIPPDECVSESVKIFEEYMKTSMTKSEFIEWVENFLTKQFMPKSTLVDREASEESLEVVELLKNYSE